MAIMDDKLSTDARIEHIGSNLSLPGYKEHTETTLAHLDLVQRPIQHAGRQDNALYILTSHGDSTVFVTSQDNARVLRLIDRR